MWGTVRNAFASCRAYPWASLTGYSQRHRGCIVLLRALAGHTYGQQYVARRRRLGLTSSHLFPCIFPTTATGARMNIVGAAGFTSSTWTTSTFSASSAFLSSSSVVATATVTSDQPVPPVAPSSSSSSSAATLFARSFWTLNLHRDTLRALKDVFGVTLMTHVQDKTIPLIARGFDVLVRSRTGTGKTLAYLIPIIERLIYKKISPNSNKISVIILVPNRELALQTAATANQLLSYHHNPNPKGPRSGGSKGDGTIMGLHGADEGRAEGGANHAYEVQTLIGGSNAREEQEPIMNSKCHILVSTPGRLVYHMKHTPGFMERTVRMDTICLDEVDRLITLGFQKDITALLKNLPTQRQTLLFSATVNTRVKVVARHALRESHVFVDAVVGLAGPSTSMVHDDIPSTVRQSLLVVPASPVALVEKSPGARLRLARRAAAALQTATTAHADVAPAAASSSSSSKDSASSASSRVALDNAPAPVPPRVHPTPLVYTVARTILHAMEHNSQEDAAPAGESNGHSLGGSGDCGLSEDGVNPPPPIRRSKILVFFSTCRMAQYFARVFNDLDVLERMRGGDAEAIAREDKDKVKDDDEEEEREKEEEEEKEGDDRTFNADAKLDRVDNDEDAGEDADFAGLSVLEIHSKKNQNYRVRVAQKFKDAQSAVMFSSDVSARGMDYPDVTAVIQVGFPSTPDEYVHRCGRTGRMGKRGHNYLIIMDYVHPTVTTLLRHHKDLHQLPLSALRPSTSTEAAAAEAEVVIAHGKATAADGSNTIINPLDMHTKTSKQVQAQMQIQMQTQMHAFLQRRVRKSSSLALCAERAYVSWLGLHIRLLDQLKWTKDELGLRANQFSASLGLFMPPVMKPSTAKTYGLTAAHGIRIGQPQVYDQSLKEQGRSMRAGGKKAAAAGRKTYRGKTMTQRRRRTARGELVDVQ